MTEETHKEATPGWGGAGRGQGRKPLSKEEPTEKISILLPSSYVTLLRELGGGKNPSAGVRRLIEEYLLRTRGE